MLPNFFQAAQRGLKLAETHSGAKKITIRVSGRGQNKGKIGKIPVKNGKIQVTMPFYSHKLGMIESTIKSVMTFRFTKAQIEVL
jgi:hypothetical protein